MWHGREAKAATRTDVSMPVPGPAPGPVPVAWLLANFATWKKEEATLIRSLSGLDEKDKQILISDVVLERHIHNGELLVAKDDEGSIHSLLLPLDGDCVRPNQAWAIGRAESELQQLLRAYGNQASTENNADERSKSVPRQRTRLRLFGIGNHRKPPHAPEQEENA